MITRNFLARTVGKGRIAFFPVSSFEKDAVFADSRFRARC